MAAWFTKEENQWMVTHHLPTFNAFDRKQTVVVDGKKVSAMQVFMTRVIEEFRETFPYRHPDTPLKSIAEKKRHLRVASHEEWNKLPAKFRHRLNYLKRYYARKSVHDDEPQFEGEGEGSDGWVTEDNAEQDDGDGETSEESQGNSSTRSSDRNSNPDVSMRDPDDQSATAPQAGTSHESLEKSHISVDKTDDYLATPERVQEWRDALEELWELTTRSWSGCSDTELRVRRGNTPENLRQVLDLIAYGAGVEAFAAGLLVSPRTGHSGFITSSPRSNQWTTSQVGLRSLKKFTAFTALYHGPTLCTVEECPGPAVYGDPNKDNHPRMPWDDTATPERNRVYIYNYQRHKLRWQGGASEVPYTRIKEEAEAGRHEIVKQEVIPPMVPYMEDPFTMPEEHVLPWVKHLVDGDNERLPEANRFQYAKPDPDGAEVQGYQRDRVGEIKMEYGPQALSYGFYLQTLRSQRHVTRADELPVHDPDEAVFTSITPEQIVFWQTRLPDEVEFAELLNVLNAHDSARPFQASSAFWGTIAPGMPHLKPELPTAEAGIRHFNTERGRLLPEFFDAQHSRHNQASLSSCLDWCRPENFIHTPSSTIMGGPFSVKWAVLMLGHLQLNARSLSSERNVARAHYTAIADHIKVTFSDDDNSRIRETVVSLRDALARSLQALTATLDDRTNSSAEVRAIRHSQVSHARFPADVESCQFFRAVQDGSRTKSVTRPLETSQEPQEVEGASTPSSRKVKGKAVESGSKAKLKRAQSIGDSPIGKRSRGSKTASTPNVEASASPSDALATLSLAGPSTRTRSKAVVGRRGQRRGSDKRKS